MMNGESKPSVAKSRGRPPRSALERRRPRRQVDVGERQSVVAAGERLCVRVRVRAHACARARACVRAGSSRSPRSVAFARNTSSPARLHAERARSQRLRPDGKKAYVTKTNTNTTPRVGHSSSIYYFMIIRRAGAADPRVGTQREGRRGGGSSSRMC